MESINPQIKALFNAYREANFVPNLPMNEYYQRIIWDSLKVGLTPEMVTAVIASRIKRKRQREYGVKGTHIQHVFGDESAPWVIDEFHHLQALGRVKVMDPNRASVLRQSGRSDQSPSPEPRSAADVELVRKLREAAQ